jgi:hypothetical protein
MTEGEKRIYLGEEYSLSQLNYWSATRSRVFHIIHEIDTMHHTNREI